MSDMIFPRYTVDSDGLRLQIGFEEFGYSYVVPVVFELRVGIFGGKWKRVSSSYWHDAMPISDFVRGDDSKRAAFAQAAAKKWREYRAGWEEAA